VIWPASWWWPEQPARVPTAGAAGLVAGLGAALFGVSAIVLKTGTLGWDEGLFRILNQVPAAAASVLTPVSHLFLPAGIIAVVVLAVVYVVARNRSVLPVAAGAAAAGLAWALAHAAKAIADRPRPYEVIADAVLRQQPAHGTSFPSSHTAVTLAVAIALVPFAARPLAAVGIGYAVLVGWSRMYLGVHYPLDVLAGAGIGMATGGVILLALGTLLRRAGRAGTSRRPPRGAAPQDRPPAPLQATSSRSAGTALAEGGDEDGLDAAQAVFREHEGRGRPALALPVASSAPTLRRDQPLGGAAPSGAVYDRARSMAVSPVPRRGPAASGWPGPPVPLTPDRRPERTCRGPARAQTVQPAVDSIFRTFTPRWMASQGSLTAVRKSQVFSFRRRRAPRIKWAAH